MCTIHQNIIIYTPFEPVWGILRDPQQWVKLNPNVCDFVFTADPKGGFEGEWVYALGRLKLRSKLRTTLVTPPTQMVLESCGQLKSQWAWYTESDGYWTHLALAVDYSAQWSSVGIGLHDLVLEHHHQTMLGVYLNNIKRAAEKSHR